MGRIWWRNDAGRAKAIPKWYIFNILELSGNGNMLQTILIQVDIVGVKRWMIVFLCKKRRWLVTKLCLRVCFVQGHKIQIPEHLYTCLFTRSILYIEGKTYLYICLPSVGFILIAFWLMCLWVSIFSTTVLMWIERESKAPKALKFCQRYPANMDCCHLFVYRQIRVSQ